MNVEQPLDLSKKEAYSLSAVKDSDGGSSRHTASPCGPKEDNHNVIPQVHNDADDVEDLPLVIDEETTDSGDVKSSSVKTSCEHTIKVNSPGL